MVKGSCISRLVRFMVIQVLSLFLLPNRMRLCILYGTTTCYDESKRYGETLSVIFAQKYKLPVKIVRPFNNYGPGLKITDKRVIPDFARNINGEDIVIYSSGSPMRTFCYISDAIIGYYKVLTRVLRRIL